MISTSNTQTNPFLKLYAQLKERLFSKPAGTREMPNPAGNADASVDIVSEYQASGDDTEALPPRNDEVRIDVLDYLGELEERESLEIISFMALSRMV